jgi:hypothetical protein
VTDPTAQANTAIAMTAAAPGPTVVVTVVSHRHGDNVYVNATEDGARQTLLAYVTEWWNEVEDQVGPMPADPAEAIRAYFDANDNEHCTTEMTVILP